MWNQVYDPFGSAVFSTLVAALPIFCLLGLIAFAKMQAHMRGAHRPRAVAVHRHRGLRHAGRHGVPVRGPRGHDGLFPIGWIILNVIFLYRLTVENGSVQGPAGFHRGDHRRPPPPAAARRLRVRGLLRGRRRLRHPRRRDRRDPDRARLLAARGLRPVPDRQHGARGLRGARHTHRDPRGGDRPRRVLPRGHGRPPAAVLLAHRAVLAHLGLRRAGAA